MKIRTNLLPYREARRKENRRRFWLTYGVVAAAGVLGVMIVHGFNAAAIGHQTDRNNYIVQENKKLDEKISEITGLRESINMLKAQQETIGRLQSDRAAPGQLLDQMVRLVPDGVYLTSLKQNKAIIEVAGMSQSADLVAAFMANLQTSPYLEKPELNEIKAQEVKGRRFQNFSLRFAVKPPAKEEDAKKPAAAVGSASAASAAASAAVVASGASVVAASSAPSSVAVASSKPAATVPSMPALPTASAASR